MFGDIVSEVMAVLSPKLVDQFPPPCFASIGLIKVWFPPDVMNEYA